MPDTVPPADDLVAMLHAHDTQLRAGAEMTAARLVTTDGPLLRGVFPWGGFVTYSSLEGVDDVDALIEDTVAHFRDQTEVAQFEWKTRGHDDPADLPERLLAHGFEAEELETVMAGSVSHLMGEVGTCRLGCGSGGLAMAQNWRMTSPASRPCSRRSSAVGRRLRRRWNA